MKNKNCPNQISTKDWTTSPCPQYNLLLMPIWQFLLVYAMGRYRLLDIQKVVIAAHRDKLAAIGTLATSINHEIRNPLYVIQGLAQSHLVNFEEGIYESTNHVVSQANEVLTKVAEQAERAMDIMRRFALFAKQGVKEKAEIQSVSLDQMLKNILPLVHHELELDKIKLIRDIPETLPLFQADQRHVEQILFNLIVNACQALKIASDKRLETSRESLEKNHFEKIELTAVQENGHVRITIADNGPGIAADQVSQIFEPFYTTKSEGTGLGLYITKQLVERNGGKISVKSKVGEGTTFTLEFKK